MLESLDEWDSLASVTVLAMYKKYLGLKIDASALSSCKTIANLLDLGSEVYE